MTAPSLVKGRCDLRLRDAAPWWKDGAVPAGLVQALRDTGLWLDFRHHGSRGAKRKRPIESDEKLVEAMRAWTPGEYALVHDATDELGAPMAELSVGPGGLVVALHVMGSALDDRRDTLLDQLARLVLRVIDLFPGNALLYSCSVTPPDPYPRVRPPLRVVAPFTAGNLLDVYDLDGNRLQLSQDL